MKHFNILVLGSNLNEKRLFLECWNEKVVKNCFEEDISMSLIEINSTKGIEWDDFDGLILFEPNLNFYKSCWLQIPIVNCFSRGHMPKDYWRNRTSTKDYFYEIDMKRSYNFEKPIRVFVKNIIAAK